MGLIGFFFFVTDCRIYGISLLGFVYSVDYSETSAVYSFILFRLSSGYCAMPIWFLLNYSSLFRLSCSVALLKRIWGFCLSVLVFLLADILYVKRID